MFAQQDSISWVGAAAAMVGVGAILVASGFGVIAIANRAADGRIGPTIVAGWILVGTGPASAASRERA